MYHIHVDFADVLGVGRLWTVGFYVPDVLLEAGLQVPVFMLLTICMTVYLCFCLTYLSPLLHCEAQCYVSITSYLFGLSDSAT